MKDGTRRGLFARLRGFLDPEPEPLSPAFVPPVPPPSTPGPAAKSAGRRVVRPPGALPEAAFLAACTRCGACLTACPEDAIVKMVDETPRLDPERIPCAMCPTVPCAAACPAEARALVPIPAAAIRIGFARFFEKLCLNHHEARSCEVCLDWCPVPGALTREPSRGHPIVDTSLCTGCGACGRHCVAYPRAIGIHPL